MIEGSRQWTGNRKNGTATCDGKTAWRNLITGGREEMTYERGRIKEVLITEIPLYRGFG
jgi:hypothetical protein